MAFKKGNIPWNKEKKGVMPTPWNKGLSKEDERIVKVVEKIKETLKKKYPNGRAPPWNKGLTKLDSRVRKIGEKISETKKRKFAKGELIVWNKGKKGVQIAWNRGKKGLQPSTRKGLTKKNCESIRKQSLKITGDWKELYGNKKAEERIKKIREARLRQRFPKITKIEKITKKLLLKMGCREMESLEECKTSIDFVCQKAVENVCQPDFVFPMRKVIIECDGDYWHGNIAFFDKLDKTQRFVRKKDKKQQRKLENEGWKIYRFWENYIKNHTKCYEEALYSVIK